MNTFAGLIALGIMFTIVVALNGLVQVSESQKVHSNESFLTYKNTAYGVSIQYPLGWKVDESANEYLMSFLQNLSSSESQTADDRQNNAIKSKISDALDAFGLEGVSDIFGLSADERAEFLQLASKLLNEGTSQVVVSVASPPENELDGDIENLSIIAVKISAASPISPNDYAKTVIEGLKMIPSNVTILQPPMEINIDGKPALKSVYTMTSPFDESSTRKILNAVAVNENIAYVLTFTSSPENYSTHAPTFEKMLQSFRIND